MRRSLFAGDPAMSHGSGVTLKQIADRAQCSVTVVSKILNGAKGSAGASEETRARVLTLARQLGYSPNFHARVLQQGKTRTIGLVCRLHSRPHFDNEFWGQLLRGVQQGARSAGHDLLIIGPTDEADELRRGVEHLRQRRIDVLVVPSEIYQYEMDALAGVDYPVVLAGIPVSAEYPSVGVDTRPGTREAMAHLKELGHREVLWVPHVRHGQVTDPQRDAEVCEEAAAAGLRLGALPLVLPENWGQDTVEQAIEEARQVFLSAFQPSGCTAILAYNERIALGIRGALDELRLSVPGDVSLLTYGDIFAHVSMPPLTVVGLGLPELGRRAAELGLEIADGTAWPRPPYREELSARLIIRRSTAAPPGGPI